MQSLLVREGGGGRGISSSSTQVKVRREGGLFDSLSRPSL